VYLDPPYFDSVNYYNEIDFKMREYFPNKFEKESWEFDMTAKRIISCLSNHQLTYDDNDKEYRSIFDHMIQKQTNHLLNEIKNSKD